MLLTTLALDSALTVQLSSPQIATDCADHLNNINATSLQRSNRLAFYQNKNVAILFPLLRESLPQYFCTEGSDG